MAMGWQGARQDQMMVLWDELPRSPGHVFYDRLQTVLGDAGFDAFAELLRRLIARGSELREVGEGSDV
jgi:hypothetical protein